MENPQDIRVFSRYLFNTERLRHNWGWFLLLGIIFIALGVLAVASPILVTVDAVIVLGALLLTAGVLQVIYAFFIREWSGFFLSLLSGFLYAAVGFMLAMHPAAGALTLTILLATFYMVGGLFRIIGSVMTRFESWGWALFSGIIKFTLGLLIFLGWPSTGLWVIGLFIGIDLIVYGWFWTLLALGARSIPPAK